jgi:hypothetical protein
MLHKEILHKDTEIINVRTNSGKSSAVQNELVLIYREFKLRFDVSVSQTKT